MVSSVSDPILVTTLCFDMDLGLVQEEEKRRLFISSRIHWVQFASRCTWNVLNDENKLKLKLWLLSNYAQFESCLENDEKWFFLMKKEKKIVLSLMKNCVRLKK